MDKVIVTVVGLQKDAFGEENRIELVSIGKHYYKNGINYVLYDDSKTCGMEKTTTLLKIASGSVTLLRKGDVTQQQYFAQAVESASEYQTPYGNLTLSVLTHKLDVCYGSVSGNIEIAYALSVNGAWQSDNHLHIKICAEQVSGNRLN